MLVHHRLALFSLLAATAVGLTACSGSPDNDDLHAALTKSVNSTHDQQDKAMKMVVGDNQQARSMLNEQRQADLKKIDGSHLIGCKSSDAGGYNCDVSVQGQVRTIRLVKDQGTWAIVSQ